MGYSKEDPSKVNSQGVLTLQNQHPSTTDDEMVADIDEPPDEKIHFRRPNYTPSKSEQGNNTFAKSKPRQNGKDSLLTRALVTTPHEGSKPVSRHERELHDMMRGLSNASTCSNASVASTADLTSDGHTSPARSNTPSPPLPTTQYMQLPPPAKLEAIKRVAMGQEAQGVSTVHDTSPKAESTVEAGLGRKRCITFACARKAVDQRSEAPTVSKEETSQNLTNDNGTMVVANKCDDIPRRPSALRFACPRQSSQETVKTPKQAPKRYKSPAPILRKSLSVSRTPTQRNSQPRRETPLLPSSSAVPNVEKPKARKQIDPESEAVRFHEFASSFEEQDEWTQESTVRREKLTVQGVLKKEERFRRLGEEAEEEALQDEEELDEEGADEDEDDADNNDDDDSVVSDEGNETDDEEGFADSDEESDAGSEYRFWVPGHTTSSATVDDADSMRRIAPRTASISSLESPSHHEDLVPHRPDPEHAPKTRSRPKKIRPRTPELPDSTDFVCGTLDEDRPMEAAYVSRIQERRRSKHIIIPQDIDPSFPRSDPEDNDDQDEDVEEEGHEQGWITGQFDEDGPATIHRRSRANSRPTPSHSPTRRPSPAPRRLGNATRSPPPRGIFGKSPKRLRSPPPARRLKSPPGNRRALVAAPARPEPIGINLAPLAERPGLTHTKSLPRTPNPFIRRYNTSTSVRLDGSSTAASPDKMDTFAVDMHNRGAIDIVKGLEKKRQRRKEKLAEKLAQKNQHRAAKEKDRKPPPGKGAQRMREVGLEMAGKGRQKYVLSI
ncbi:MAG: hypothetical protein M1824_003983 [Vezdaea acicularis]|nr:MAG: hypothetical protein M1824_003983 [Vezdaea acicularis]